MNEQITSDLTAVQQELFYTFITPDLKTKDRLFSSGQFHSFQSENEHKMCLAASGNLITLP